MNAQPQQLGFIPLIPAAIGVGGAVVGYKTANILDPSNTRTLYLVGAAALVALLILRR